MIYLQSKQRSRAIYALTDVQTVRAVNIHIALGAVCFVDARAV